MKSTTSYISDQDVECITTYEFVAGVNSLSTTLRNVVSLMLPMIDVAFIEQSIKECINLKKTQSVEHGLWGTFVAINSETLKLLVENDSSYTVVSIPNQLPQKNRKRDYRFFI